ncbi:hypothetical protein BDN70DRAFT_873902 [Pholiota conissans]|uniref:Uncharacterized protein n=1 Tax=Pholiota conissans TaxID=109636 RepID=A0A9P5Z960_9AGAR|nr:hypothetical protein BDN70DRAFT_873902 [Pholiota conissans]
MSANRVERPNIDRTEPCFITNTSSYVHQRQHWINAIQGKEKKDQALRHRICKFLSAIGVARTGFTLDHPSNLSNLDAGLHSAMDKFAMFAVTCTQATLDVLIKIIQRENEIEQQGFDDDRDYIRNLEITRVSDIAQYEIVVLQPKYFLPNKEYLMRRNDLEDSPKHYQMDSNGVLREAPLTADSPRYPPFCSAGNRERGHRLNPYLVVLAAEIKFQRYRECSHLPQLDAEYEALMAKTTEVVNLLFWEPLSGNTSLRHFSAPSEGMKDGKAGGSAPRLLGGRATKMTAVDCRTFLSVPELSLDSDDKHSLRHMCYPCEREPSPLASNLDDIMKTSKRLSIPTQQKIGGRLPHRIDLDTSLH